ncbi:MAG: response regulator, partial [Desulfosudaceae bacterium]
NLCVNARDAIGGVGTMTIETRLVHLDASDCADQAERQPGDYVLLTVSDDGSGMLPETLENIFEPFFTTKDVHQGTGLGLATVYGIVKQNKGFIHVDSEVGRGTIFRIYLPPHSEPVTPEAETPPAKMPVGRGEQVLLVEDDPAIREMGREMLTELGYRVLTAASPPEALRLAGEQAGRLHLLLTDVVMPEMDGSELAEQISARFPDIRILFMSGYTADVIAHHGILEDGVNFVQKPFSVRELASRVRRILDAE